MDLKKNDKLAVVVVEADIVVISGLCVCGCHSWVSRRPAQQPWQLACLGTQCRSFPSGFVFRGIKMVVISLFQKLVCFTYRRPRTSWQKP